MQKKHVNCQTFDRENVLKRTTTYYFYKIKLYDIVTISDFIWRAFKE